MVKELVKKINHKIDGATTWTPGDKMAFDAMASLMLYQLKTL
jgi:hypothetical protein